MTRTGLRWRSFILLATVSACHSSADTGPARSDAQVAAELSPIIRRIEAAARTKNPSPIVALVHPEGMPCGDEVLSRSAVVSEIKTPGRQLNAFFFDGTTLRRDYEDLEINMSLLEYEQRAKEPKLEFINVHVAKSGAVKTACARLRDRNVAYTPVMCFFREGGKWFLASAGRFCE